MKFGGSYRGGRKWGTRQLEQDAAAEGGRFSKMASQLEGAKSSGRGLGGLLGGIAGPALLAMLAPVTGGASLALAGAVGAGLGSMAGEQIGKATSGVDESDLKGKFHKGSRIEQSKDSARSSFTDHGKNILSGALQGFKGADKWGEFGKVYKEKGLKDAIGTKLGFMNKHGVSDNLDNTNTLEGWINPETGMQGTAAEYDDLVVSRNANFIDDDGWDLGDTLNGDISGDASNTSIPGLNDINQPNLSRDSMASDLINLQNDANQGFAPSESTFQNTNLPTLDGDWMQQNQQMYLGPHGLRGQIDPGLQDFISGVNDWEITDDSMYSPTYGTPSHMQELWGTDEWEDWYPSVK